MATHAGNLVRGACFGGMSHPSLDESLSLLNAAHLAGPIDTTEKPTEVPRQPHKQHCDRFDWQPVFW